MGFLTVFSPKITHWADRYLLPFCTKKINRKFFIYINVTFPHAAPSISYRIPSRNSLINGASFTFWPWLSST